jgi:hypothetical protein
MLCACDWLHLHVYMSVCGCVFICVNIIYSNNKLEFWHFLLYKYHERISAFCEAESGYQTLHSNVLVLTKHDASFRCLHFIHAKQCCYAWYKLTEALQTFPIMMKYFQAVGHIKIECFFIIFKLLVTISWGTDNQD